MWEKSLAGRGFPDQTADDHGRFVWEPDAPRRSVEGECQDSVG